MKRKITLLLLCVLALVGCSSIESGAITQKVYTAPYDSFYYQCVSFDKNGFCTVNMPMTQHNPATYRFDLQQGDKTGWVYVNEHDYNSHKVGDYWPSND